MDDLLGEDWQAPSKPSASGPSASLKPNAFASNYSSFRNSPTVPLSGTTSPQSISRPPSSVNGAAKAPASDSFGSLLSLKSQKQTSNVSIQERQRQLAEDKRRQQDEQSHLWDTLGSGRGTPEIRVPSPAGNAQKAEEDEDDILAAFNKAAPVNKASHFPPPSSEPLSRRSTPAATEPAQAYSTNDNDVDDDDPFGLGSMPQKQSGNLPTRRLQKEDYDDDDILGDLGRPLTEKTTAPAPAAPARRREVDSPSVPDDEQSDDLPQDRAVAELVDMGFPADNARIALAENGGDVQGAVGWLLQQAHEESRAKSRGDAISRQRSPNGDASPPRRRREDEALPSWMRQETRTSSASRRQDSRSPAGGDRDASQVAQDFGSKFLKGANSLWKASQKQMAKTVSEFQQDREPHQPKWMQDSGRTSDRSQSQRRAEAKANEDVTDEAAMLDMPRERPAKPSRNKPSGPTPEQPTIERRPAKPLPHRASPQPRFMQQPPAAQDKRPASKLSRQEVEDQAAQAYVSPARRKRPTPKPEPTPEPEVDLFSPAPTKPPSAVANGASSKAPTPTPASRASTAPPKPKAPPRNIPSVTPSALNSSAAHRKTGGEAFKRGDYASAHDSYTAALSPLPPTHPITIIVLSNRALTALKTGDAKTAVSDADQALTIIGVSQGVGESIDLGGAEGTKDMREFYGKALMRKAEALEHLEKWSDAAAVWRQAIEAGVGGAVSIRGRDRCENAATPKPAAAKPAPARSPAPGAVRAPPAKGLGNSMQRPTISAAVSAEAVKKLRAANAAAEKADDEKFQLADQVDAKLTAWKGGKADNLRALLQSLDNVLWADAGWKKVGMSDLVMPNKVKIIYMKAIAKVHPDKISQDATTEQRMVSAAVFSTLNEAWDKFKKDNNL